MTENSTYYTYIHSKPGGEPFYVGKGKGKRSHDFINGRNKSYLEIIDLYGAENIEVQVFAKENEEEAFRSEIEYIKSLREAGYELSNKSDGGEGKSREIVVRDTPDLSIKDLSSLARLVKFLEQALVDRDKLIFELFMSGLRQRALAKVVNLSESRVKAICKEQKRLAAKMTGEMK